MQPLPFETVDWVDPEKVNLDSYLEDGAKVCFLDVDLDYRDELHAFHNNYPLAAKKTKVTKELMSERKLQIIKRKNFCWVKTKNLFLI